MKKNTKFEWTSEHQKEFDYLKNIPLQNLIHYNPHLPIYIFSDASQVGVGGVMLQPCAANLVKKNPLSDEVLVSLKPIQNRSKKFTGPHVMVYYKDFNVQCFTLIPLYNLEISLSKKVPDIYIFMTL